MTLERGKEGATTGEVPLSSYVTSVPPREGGREETPNIAGGKLQQRGILLLLFLLYRRESYYRVRGRRKPCSILSTCKSRGPVKNSLLVKLVLVTACTIFVVCGVVGDSVDGVWYGAAAAASAAVSVPAGFCVCGGGGGPPTSGPLGGLRPVRRFQRGTLREIQQEHGEHRYHFEKLFPLFALSFLRASLFASPSSTSPKPTGYSPGMF